MGRIREMAEQCWSGEIEPYTCWSPTGAPRGGAKRPVAVAFGAGCA